MRRYLTVLNSSIFESVCLVSRHSRTKLVKVRKHTPERAAPSQPASGIKRLYSPTLSVHLSSISCSGSSHVLSYHSCPALFPESHRCARDVPNATGNKGSSTTSGVFVTAPSLICRARPSPCPQRRLLWNRASDYGMGSFCKQEATVLSL